MNNDDFIINNQSAVYTSRVKNLKRVALTTRSLGSIKNLKDHTKALEELGTTASAQDHTQSG